jgi:hypothetical protein
VDRIRTAVALPLRIAIKDVYDETCTELLVAAQLDSGVCVWVCGWVGLSVCPSVHPSVCLSVCSISNQLPTAPSFLLTPPPRACHISNSKYRVRISYSACQLGQTVPYCFSRDRWRVVSRPHNIGSASPILHVT